MKPRALRIPARATFALIGLGTAACAQRSLVSSAIDAADVRAEVRVADFDVAALVDATTDTETTLDAEALADSSAIDVATESDLDGGPDCPDLGCHLEYRLLPDGAHEVVYLRNGDASYEPCEPQPPGCGFV